jgi:hypothetical protein
MSANAKTGTIEFGGGGFDCTIRNIFDKGAALEVVSPLFIPDRFALFVPSDQLKRPCHIVWRKEKRIGVSFELPLRLRRSRCIASRAVRGGLTVAGSSVYYPQ